MINQTINNREQISKIYTKYKGLNKEQRSILLMQFNNYKAV